MYLYAVENPHEPSVITLLQLDKCELCRAFVEAADYDEHAHSHAPKKETAQTPKLSRGKPE